MKTGDPMNWNPAERELAGGGEYDTPASEQLRFEVQDFEQRLEIGPMLLADLLEWAAEVDCSACAAESEAA